MTNPTSQLEKRYGDLSDAVDELLDAVSEAGPGSDEHERVLEAVADKHPKFVVHLMRLAALRQNDDTSPITADSPAGKAVVKLTEDQGDKVVATLQKEKANRVLASLVALGVSARLNGLTQWQPSPAAIEAAAKEL